MRWDAESYDKVSTVQESWGRRLLDGLSCRGDEVAADAGCGSGRLTVLLLEKFPEGRIYAIDRSPEMLEAARRKISDRDGRVFFLQGDLTEAILPEPIDLIFSNATFHWILDHAALFTNLYGWLRPGGRLLAQCGGKGNIDLTHEIAMEISHAPEFAAFFREWEPPWSFASAEDAAQRLKECGFVEVETELIAAPTEFAGQSSLLQFVRTVPLLPFLSCLPSDDSQRLFLQRYLDELLRRNGGRCLLDYVRLNIRARRSAT